jgi:UDP-N-acetylmuramyl pentapeptide phosphotransferase/UDP-N-acetylglucosamine-1-phosphate transferase
VTVLLALLVGFLAGRMVWLLLRPLLRAPVFARDNYRGHALPTAAGLVLAVAVMGAEAVRVVAGSAAGDDSRLDGPRVAVLLLAGGLALLGLVDDLAGDGDRRGFRGHVMALASGRLSTGGLKLFGGGALALLAVATARPGEGLGSLLADAALVALAANLGNLFDRAPGRTIKVGTLAFVALVAATSAAAGLAGPAVVVGGALALLPDDLHEHLMLGDTGANLLGGVVGLGVVTVCGPVPRLAVLGAVLVLNGISEWVSFSRVIDRVLPLRLLDRAGQRPRSPIDRAERPEGYGESP